MTKISEDFVIEQVSELKDRDDVKAVGIVGSYARNPDGEHNDLDIYVVVDGEWRRRVTEEVDGVVVEKFFNSEEWAKHYFERDESPWYMVRWMDNIDVRYDPEDLFSELKELGEEKKEDLAISEDEEDKILYEIWDRQQDLGRMEDVGQKRFFMNDFVDYLVQTIYRLNEVVPVKENYRIKKLSDFDGYTYKLVQEFLNSSSTYEKEQKLEKIISRVTRKLGEPSPEWETEKEFLG